MKRAFTIMLMTAVLLLSLLVPVAGELIEYDYPRNTVLLWNADENWGDRYTLDMQNQTEGEGCISINLNGVTGTHAPFKKLDPVDATGMLALEFDMYISDLAILDHLQTITSGSIEICSGGSCDQGEKNFSLSALAKKLQKGCPRVGWNHIILRFADMNETNGSYGPFTPSNIDYLRIYWTGMTDCGQDWTMKFDNFVLTDREVEPGVPHTPGEWQYDENKHWRYCTECDKKIDETFHSEHSHPPYVYDREFTCYACKQVCGPLNERGKYASFIQQIEWLYQLSEDDFDLESMKEQYNALMSEWDALAEDERQLLTVGGYEKMLKIVKKAIEVCEEKLAILNKYESLIAELSWLKDFLQESNWTWENWQRAGDIATASREMVDSMKRTEKEVLREYGYLAVLEEAEDRVFIISDPIDDQTPQTPAVPVAPSDDGCSSVVTGGTLCLLAIISAAGWMLRKKKK